MALRADDPRYNFIGAAAGRLSSVVFPAFVWLAAVVPPRQHTGWIVTFAMMQAMCAALFYTWRPLF